VSLRKRLRTLFVCLVLEFGVLSGVPMQARELEELMRQLHTPKIAHELPSEEEGGDPPEGYGDASQPPG
jgi:hypothetical protein